MSMIRDALHYLQEHLGEAHEFDDGERPVYDRRLFNRPAPDDLPMPETLRVWTLKGLVDYFGSGLDLFDASITLSVATDGTPTVERAGILRTARKLMDGVVFPRDNP